MPDIPEIPDRPTILPLDPMPAAPPDIAAAWMERIGKGALLGLIMLLFGFCATLISASGHSFHETISVFVYLLSSVAGLIVLWLITSSEPGNPYWLIYLRWGARIGYVVGIIHDISGLMIRGFITLPIIGKNELVIAYSILMLINLAGMVIGVWYYARLSARLGDRVLRRNFGALKWICGVLVVGIVIYALADWQGFCETNFKKLASYRAKSWLFGWACFVLPLSVYSGWLEWRLWRRLRATANSLREMDEISSGEES